MELLVSFWKYVFQGVRQSRLGIFASHGKSYVYLTFKEETEKRSLGMFEEFPPQHTPIIADVYLFDPLKA